MGLIIMIGVVSLVVGGGVAIWMRVTKRNPFKQQEATGKALTEKERVDARRLGYRYAEEAPFFFIKDNGVWTGVRLNSSTDEFDTPSEQEGTVVAGTAMRQELLDYFTNKHPKREARVPCHELVRNRPVDTSEWLESYHHSHWDPSGLLNMLIDGKVEPHIAEAAPERAHYLLVRIGDQKGPVNVDAVSAAINADDALCDELFTRHELVKFRKLAMEVLDRLAPYSRSPMTRSDLSWLIRKPLSGSFPVDTERDYSRTRFVRNSWFDMLTDFTGRNLKQQAAVEIFDPAPSLTDTPDSCFTSTLTISTAESQVPFEYWQAWGRMLANLPNPPEISWRYALISEAVFTKQILKATASIADEVRDRTKDGSEEALTDTSFGHKAAEAEEVRDSMKLRPRAGMVGQLRISISAPNLEQLAVSEQSVRDVMKGFCVLERRKNIQATLLEEQLPGDFDASTIGKLVASTDAGGMDVGTRWTDLDVLAMARMDASPTVGDDIEVSKLGDRLGWHGHVIGYAAENGSIVHFDPFVQMARNAGAGIAIVGASGSGKSTLALSLFFWVSESGAQVVVLDPKNDFEKFCHYIAFGPQVLHDHFRDEANRGVLGTDQSQFQPINQAFWDETRIVSLTFGASGSMDPWLLTGDFDAGEQLARRQIEHLFADLHPSSPERNQLDLAFAELRRHHDSQLVSGVNPPLPRLADLATHVARKVEEYQQMLATDTSRGGDLVAITEALDRVKVLQNRLDSAAKSDYSRLLFGTHDIGADASALRGFAHRRTIITMIGFKMPKDSSQITTNTGARNASAAMFTVLWQVERLFSAIGETMSPNQRKKGLRPRILFVDEAYMITAMPAGAEMLNVALRQGRSLNFGVVVISQQADDIGKIEEATAKDDADQNQFPTMFVFKQRSLAEAKSALRILRSDMRLSESDEANLAQQLQLPTGMCAMKDMDGRVSTVAVDPLFKELFGAAQTNASQRTRYQSQPISSDPMQWTLQTEIRDTTRRDLVRDRIDDAADSLMSFDYPEVEPVA